MKIKELRISLGDGTNPGDRKILRALLETERGKTLAQVKIDARELSTEEISFDVLLGSVISVLKIARDQQFEAKR